MRRVPKNKPAMGVKKRGRGRPAVRWLEAEVENERVSGMVLRVQLPGGATVEIEQPEQIGLVAALLKELAGHREGGC